MFFFLGVLLVYSSSSCSVVKGNNAVSGDLYSSLTHMGDLFIFDNILGELLPLFPSYIPEVNSYQEAYSGLTRDVLDLGEGDVLSIAITGNPLHTYSVIKRLVLYWPKLWRSISIINDSEVNCIDRNEYCSWWAERSECENNPPFMLINCQQACGFCGKPELLGKLPKLEEFISRTVLPSENDLRGASLALARLQQVYRIPILSMAEGKIANVSTRVGLTIYDCMRIANESYYEGEYANAWLWYNYAEAIEKEPDLKAHISALKGTVATEHDEHFRRSSTKFFPRRLSKKPLQRPYDPQYAKLCRGYSFMDEEDLAELKCYISSRGSPYLILQPVKYERVHDELEMYIFYDVLSDNEIQAIKQTAKDLLSRSQVVSSDNPVEIRVSQTAWLTNDTHPLLPGVARRISDVTGLHVFEGPFEDNMAGENLQVLSYGIGGHYHYHVDCFWKDEEEDEWESYRDEYDHYESGDRMATWMFYLSDVEAGGRTAFPNAGVSVEPVKGAAAFWFNINKNGYGNQLAQHGGCPVLLGHKWVANKWIRENHNYLRRPCSLHSDE